MSISSLPPSGFPPSTPPTPSTSGGPLNFKAAQAYAANRPTPATNSPTANTPVATSTPKVTDQVSFSAVAGPSVAGKIQPKAKVGTATPVVQPTAASQAASRAKIDSIVAAQVPGKVSFDSTSSSTPSPAPAATPAPALPFYTNPTMKNNAATGIAASRSLDMQA